MAKPVVFVIGATGNIGSATVAELASKHGGKVDIRAGVRNPESEKADKLKGLTGVTVVQAEMGDNDKLVKTFKGVDSLYIVTPGAENRAPLTIATAKAAESAGVKHLAVVSAPTVALPDTVFGRQLTDIEESIKKLSIPYTFIRLPLFIENYFGFKDPIQGQSSIYSPVDPTKPYTPVAVADAAKAAAVVLTDPSKHTNKIYLISSDRHTFNDVATAFSEALGKEVKYVQVPYDAAKEAFIKTGVPEWQTDGILELYRLIDDGSPFTNLPDISNFTTLTGEKPTDLKTWVSQVAGAFK